MKANYSEIEEKPIGVQLSQIAWLRESSASVIFIIQA